VSGGVAIVIDDDGVSAIVADDDRSRAASRWA
jgi:hypothetical protein